MVAQVLLRQRQLLLDESIELLQLGKFLVLRGVSLPLLHLDDVELVLEGLNFVLLELDVGDELLLFPLECTLALDLLDLPALLHELLRLDELRVLRLEDGDTALHL